MDYTDIINDPNTFMVHPDPEMFKIHPDPYEQMVITSQDQYWEINKDYNISISDCTSGNWMLNTKFL